MAALYYLFLLCLLWLCLSLCLFPSLPPSNLAFSSHGGTKKRTRTGYSIQIKIQGSRLKSNPIAFIAGFRSKLSFVHCRLARAKVCSEWHRLYSPAEAGSREGRVVMYLKWFVFYVDYYDYLSCWSFGFTRIYRLRFSFCCFFSHARGIALRRQNRSTMLGETEASQQLSLDTNCNSLGELLKVG